MTGSETATSLSPGLSRKLEKNFTVRDRDFKVVRPTRAGMQRINRLISVTLSEGGVQYYAVRDGIDGHLVEAECHLAEILVEAPEHWWGQPDPQGKRTISMEQVYEDELEEVWSVVRPWLETFRFRPKGGPEAGQQGGGAVPVEGVQPVQPPPAAG